MPISRDDPFAPPQAAIGPALEADPNGTDDSGTDDSASLACFLCWEKFRFFFNIILITEWVALMWFDLVQGWTTPVVLLFLDAVIINLGFSIGPILPRSEWRSPQAAAVLAAVGIACSGMTTALVVAGFTVRLNG